MHPPCPLIALLAASTAASLGAMDLPGAGESPGVLPAAWWVGWGNDYLGNAPSYSSDDFRTNRFMAGWRIGAWTFAADWSNLTTTNPGGAYPEFGTADPYAVVHAGAERSDELTLSATAGRAGGDALAWRAAAGPGVRIAGDLGGAWLQERVHQDTASHQVDLPYETGVVPLAAVLVVRGGLEWPARSPTALVLDGAALATTVGEVQADLALRAVWRGPGGAVWLGWRQALRGGSTAGEVAGIVADHERGGWMVAGIEAPSAVFTLAANSATDAVEGIVQVRGADARSFTGGSPVEAELGVAAGGVLADDGNGYDLRVRWGLPDPTGWWTKVLRATLTARRIERSLASTWDLAGRSYQVIAGAQLDAWPTPAQGPVAVPYAGFGAGWHHANVRSVGPADYTAGGTLDTAVADAEIGLRLGWCGRDWRSGAAIAWERQEFAATESVPWSTVDKSGETELATAGTSIILRWWVGIAW